MRVLRGSLRIVLVLGLLLAAACAGTRRTPTDGGPQAAAAPTPAAVPNLFDVQRQIDEYVSSGRYDADVAQVAGAAQAYVESRAPVVPKPAIVLDIDETSLSNWRAYKLNGWARIVNGDCDLVQGPCGLRTWQALGQSPALPPTLALVRRARALGVAVFFVSGRPAALRDATERNLREQGFEWDEVIINPEGARFASAIDFKAPERRKIAECGYTILLSIGDQESDLAGGYAERTFKLPNPVYSIP
jgi:predicted secreted acid phosphatase